MSGRTDALGEARNLVSLLGSLSEAGDTITADTISLRLGVTKKEATKLLDLIVSAGSVTQEYLPLADDSDSGDQYVLMSGRGTKGRPLRLTISETIALDAALNVMGVPAHDPLRSQLRRGFAAESVDDAEVARTLAPLAQGDLSKPLAVCSQALLEGTTVVFRYRGTSDQYFATREALPKSMSFEYGHWYLDAYDVDKGAYRTFRVDRMANVALGKPPATTDETNPKVSDKRIELVFSDDRYLTLYEWPGLEVVSREDKRITCTIPYYENNTSWLVRRIASCGGSVTTEDEGIMSSVREYARHLLHAAEIRSKDA